MRHQSELLLHGKHIGSAQAQEAPSSMMSRKKALPDISYIVEPVRVSQADTSYSPLAQTSQPLAVSGRSQS